MKIIQIVQEFSLKGGIESVAFELQSAWQKHNIESTVFAGTAPGYEARQDIVLVNAPFSKVATRGKLGRYLGRLLVVPLFSIAVSKRVYGVKTKHVILSHGDSFVGDAVVIHAVNKASIESKKKVGEFKWMFNPLHWWVSFRDWYMIKGLRYKIYIAVSNRVAIELCQYYKVPANRIAVIPNGVNTERFAPAGTGREEIREEFNIASADKVLLFVGHEFGRKGLRPIIEALPHLANNTRLIVVGNGDIAPYKQLACEVNVADRVHFAGQRTDLPRLYRAADAFIFPTSYEAFALVAMEAMASGLPVYATRVGGIEDYLVDGENGFFIEANKDSITRIVNNSIGDNVLMARVRENARNTSLKYNWDSIADLYLKVLNKVENNEFG